MTLCLLGTTASGPRGQEAEPTSASVFDDRVVHDRDVYAGFDDHHLLRTAMLFPRLQQIFEDALRQCADVASETDGHPQGWLEREVARHAHQIRAAVHADTRKAFSNERFEQEVAWMLTFARQRSGEVLRQVGR